MSKQSTLQPLERGDILVGCTVLNNAEDDHAGDGRIIQYDANLKEKGVLWVEQTTHLVAGLRFGPDKSLWAFDSQKPCVLRFDTQGQPLPVPELPKRAFSSINFLADGSFLLGEHLVGNQIKLPPGRPLGTTLPKMPGTDLFGKGHVLHFKPDGTLVREYETQTNGGMGGFLGVTTASLSPDGRTLVYSSETGPHVYRFDIQDNRQLTDLLTLPQGEMVLVAAHMSADRLVMIKARMAGGPPVFQLQQLDAEGKVLHEQDLPGGGWATILPSPVDAEIVYIGNFFTGTLARMVLATGEIQAQAETGVKRSLAGIAQFTG
ncbi:MAG: WD40 repeat domain-containing protein [Chromatiales bacterium]|nr:WD40 repeat domain-containing protein [Chromatiales bacterium]